MSKHLTMMLALLALLAAATGCKGVQQTLNTAATTASTVVQQNPGLIQNEQQRTQVLAAAKTVTEWTGEIGVPEEGRPHRRRGARAAPSPGRRRRRGWPTPAGCGRAARTSGRRRRPPRVRRGGAGGPASLAGPR